MTNQNWHARQRKLVKCEICSFKWNVKENSSKICGKFVARSFVRAFFGAFMGPNQVIYPFQAISLLLEAF